MSTQSSSNKIAGKVASHVPGRIRFKLDRRNRSQKHLEDIKHKLEALPGINNVRLNADCGSVTVHYSHEHHSMGGILRFLEDLDVIVESIGHLPSVSDEVDAKSESGLSLGFIEAINDLNRRLHKATKLPIDLKVMLPLAFVGAGAWSIGKKGLMIESVPGWLFLWFAFDMFVKMHPVKHRSSEQ